MQKLKDLVFSRRGLMVAILLIIVIIIARDENSIPSMPKEEQWWLIGRDGYRIELQEIEPGIDGSEKGPRFQVTRVNPKGDREILFGGDLFEHVFIAPTGGVIAAVTLWGGELWVDENPGARRVGQNAWFNGSFSPDNKMIAWVRGPGPEGSIAVTNLSTGMTWSLADGQSPLFSPDGRFIAFTASRGTGGLDAVWIAPVAGGDARQVTNIGLRYAPGRIPDIPKGYISPPTHPADYRWEEWIK